MEKKLRTYLFSVFIAALWGLTPCLASPKLIEDGKPLGVVVVSDSPSPIAEYAAEELVTHLQKATDVSLPIVSESEMPADGTPRVFVGECKSVKKAGIAPDRLDPDVALIRVVDSDLFIVGRENDANPLSTGNNHSGTLFGVYEFLEKELGVRWLWPGELGTYVPAARDISFPEEPHQRIEPAIQHRHIWNLGWGKKGDAQYQEDMRVFARRHRLGHTRKAPSPAHSFQEAGDGQSWWERYGEEHPEWFALNEEGERVNTGMCVSNPELHEYIAERYKHYLETGFEEAPKMWRRGGPEWIVLGDRDSGWLPCQCEDCRAWDGTTEDSLYAERLYDRFGSFATSDRYVRFYQAVYEEASEYNPDVKVSGYLYWSYFPAPSSDLQISSQIYGHFAPWGATGFVHFPIGEKALNWLKEQWRGWEKTGMSLIYRPNHWNGGYVMPHFETQGAEFFKWAYANGMDGFKFDKSREQWGVHGPMNYLYYRLFANPELEIKKVLGEYYKAFGPASKYVKEYFQYWKDYTQERHRVVDIPPGTMFGNDYKLLKQVGPLAPDPLTNAAATADAFPPKVYNPAEQLLQKALTVAQEGSRAEYAERVKFLQKGLEHARLASEFWDSLEVKSATDAEIPEDPEKRKKAIDAFAALQGFRKTHSGAHFSNFGQARQAERRGTDIAKLKELMENSQDN